MHVQTAGGEMGQGPSKPCPLYLRDINDALLQSRKEEEVISMKERGEIGSHSCDME